MSESITTIKGIEQGRAKKAYDFALEGLALGDSKAPEYKAYVKKLPMMIKTNGLGASLAFVKSKQKKDAYKKIYLQLTEWLSKESEITKGFFRGKSTDLVKDIIEMDSYTYRAVTVETLALLAWVSRFAEGLIEKDAAENI